MFVESKDGTKVPMFIVGKKGLQMNGCNPTLLYGYGGDSLCSMPHFLIFFGVGEAQHHARTANEYSSLCLNFSWGGMLQGSTSALSLASV